MWRVDFQWHQWCSLNWCDPKYEINLKINLWGIPRKVFFSAWNLDQLTKLAFCCYRKSLYYLNKYIKYSVRNVKALPYKRASEIIRCYLGHHAHRFMYRHTSNISRTKSLKLNVSRLVLQLSLPNPLKPGVKLRTKMQLEQRRQEMLQLHLSDQQFWCLLRCDLY